MSLNDTPSSANPETFLLHFERLLDTVRPEILVLKERLAILHELAFGVVRQFRNQKQQTLHLKMLLQFVQEVTVARVQSYNQEGVLDSNQLYTD